MKRYHPMPFGAEIVPDGGVRFRLWAPAAQRVELCLDSGGRTARLDMPARADGWFERVAGAARAGDRYRYRIDGGREVPDPASRCNPDDVHGPSQVVDPCAFTWEDGDWRGRPWEEAILYELHVGTFTPSGTFAGIKERLDYLVELGVTAVELMPVAAFPGARNWGYDGVLPFAPESHYGRPEALKDLVQSAHQKGLMILLDVVYNHFGPEGNYLHLYAPQFFSERHHTPWGAALNFDGPNSRPVRDFFIHNALYWLQEYHFDGLRLDAVHAIPDNSRPDILTELAEAVRCGPGKERHIHLVLENDHNAARYLERQNKGQPRWYTAQWNDDIHHALHVLTTGEGDGYYADYAERPVRHLGRCLCEGFAFQGEPSPYRGQRPRGEPSRHLPPAAFVSFLQTHDQVGNRAYGERATALGEPAAIRCAVAVVLLAPCPPLLFMGEEFGASQPFLFFCDFGSEVAAAVTTGRRREFAAFHRFSDPAAQEAIPDPNALATFQRSKLEWTSLSRPRHESWLNHYQYLLALRRRWVVPRLRGAQGGRCRFSQVGARGLAAHWQLGDGSGLALLANLGTQPLDGFRQPAGEMLYASSEHLGAALAEGGMPAWSVAWFLQREDAEPAP